VSDKLISGVVAILLALVGVAIVALLVSRSAQTGSVLSAGSSAFSGSLACALSPVTGGGCHGTNSLNIPIVNSTVTFPQ
jgi:PRD1 phage membrane DNA delivery